MTKGIFKSFIAALMVCVMSSCKKSADTAPIPITTKNLFIERITSNEIIVNYELSDVGYEETGIVFYKKETPQQTSRIKAIRVNNILKVSLQELEAETEYQFKVYHKLAGTNIDDTKDYSAKTLSTLVAQYDLRVVATDITMDENGSFTINIEGKNLRDLNLAHLSVVANKRSVQLQYPTHVAGDTYKMQIRGFVEPESAGILFEGFYYDNQVLIHYLPLNNRIAEYILHYASTGLRGNCVSVFDKDLYYFYDQKILKWDDNDERLLEVGSFGESERFTIPTSIGVQYDGQLFFRAFENSYWREDDLANYVSYPDARSWSPSDRKWREYTFIEEKYPAHTKAIGYSQVFIHKGDLYLAYSLFDIHQPGPVKTYDYIYRYNKSSKTFIKLAKFTGRIRDYRFVSLDNQLYLVGSAPVYDQGYEMTSTLVVYKVSDVDFGLEEIYRGGTIYEPVSFVVRDAIAYEKKILLGQTTTEFMIFDPAVLQMSQVQVASPPYEQFGNLFLYNNKLHINPEIHLSNKKMHEIVITKTP